MKKKSEIEKLFEPYMKKLDESIKKANSVWETMRGESAYLMDKVAKDKAAKELLPHYSLILQIFRRSNVFVTQDSFKNLVDDINKSLEALDIRLREAQTMASSAPFDVLCPKCKTIMPHVDAGANEGVSRISCLSCGSKQQMTEESVGKLRKSAAKSMVKKGGKYGNSIFGIRWGNKRRKGN